MVSRGVENAHGLCHVTGHLRSGSIFHLRLITNDNWHTTTHKVCVWLSDFYLKETPPCGSDQSNSHWWGEALECFKTPSVSWFSEIQMKYQSRALNISLSQFWEDSEISPLAQHHLQSPSTSVWISEAISGFRQNTQSHLYYKKITWLFNTRASVLWWQVLDSYNNEGYLTGPHYVECPPSCTLMRGQNNTSESALQKYAIKSRNSTVCGKW